MHCNRGSSLKKVINHKQGSSRKPCPLVLLKSTVNVKSCNDDSCYCNMLTQRNCNVLDMHEQRLIKNTYLLNKEKILGDRYSNNTFT